MSCDFCGGECGQCGGHSGPPKQKGALVTHRGDGDDKEARAGRPGYPPTPTRWRWPDMFWVGVGLVAAGMGTDLHTLSFVGGVLMGYSMGRDAK